ILVLTFTVGTWVLGFVAAFQVCVWEQIAGYTPSEMLQAFRRGLVRLDLVLAALVVIATSLVLAAVWMRLGPDRAAKAGRVRRWRRRGRRPRFRDIVRKAELGRVGKREELVLRG